jgi:hypothetical protein
MSIRIVDRHGHPCTKETISELISYITNNFSNIKIIDNYDVKDKITDDEPTMLFYVIDGKELFTTSSKTSWLIFETIYLHTDHKISQAISKTYSDIREMNNGFFENNTITIVTNIDHVDNDFILSFDSFIPKIYNIIADMIGVKNKIILENKANDINKTQLDGINQILINQVRYYRERQLNEQPIIKTCNSNA